MIDTQTPVADPAVRTAGAWCVLGAAVAAVGAVVTATATSSVPVDQLSEPYSPAVFRATEVLWTLTHVLTFLGALGLARSGLVGGSRTGRVGVRTMLAGMALLVPAELGFAFFPTASDDSTAAAVLGTFVGLAATAAGIGFTLAGVATLRAGRWTGRGRWTPLLCGLAVLLVLLPVQAVRPSAFLWPIAGWNLCLLLLGLALRSRAAATLPR